MLTVSDLTISFPTPNGLIEPVKNFNLDLQPGTILGLAGPSGCGKTVLCTTLLGMLEKPGRISAGSIRYTPALAPVGTPAPTGAPVSAPLELSSLAEKDWRRIRGKDIAMIFQNPVQALNPSRTVCSQFIEAIRVHKQKTSRQECKQLAETMLEEVMFPEPKRVLNSYPFELSGGMCQRVLIAMSMIHHPALLIADEPTTALDTSNQTHILRLFAQIRERFHTAILLVSHDEQVIATTADRTVRMDNSARVFT